MRVFFKVVQTDMNLCLEQLNDLRLPGKMRLHFPILVGENIFFCGVE